MKSGSTLAAQSAGLHNRRPGHREWRWPIGDDDMSLCVWSKLAPTHICIEFDAATSAKANRESPTECAPNIDLHAKGCWCAPLAMTPGRDYPIPTQPAVVFSRTCMESFLYYSTIMMLFDPSLDVTASNIPPYLAFAANDGQAVPQPVLDESYHSSIMIANVMRIARLSRHLRLPPIPGYRNNAPRLRFQHRIRSQSWQWRWSLRKLQRRVWCTSWNCTCVWSQPHYNFDHHRLFRYLRKNLVKTSLVWPVIAYYDITAVHHGRLQIANISCKFTSKSLLRASYLTAPSPWS